ncbi:hypothetical protein NBRC111894_4098 [Sporolactobacillus inulinus]|uniref:Uncharacterized protein n=1 Tax=Sporolactobacillus inulinus TaxID=2078 RepID=A0A4Y1ZI12_9BACL|nr:hypothetical protein NBRC111894_4098 [Sporolactobacillus inulinus]
MRRLREQRASETPQIPVLFEEARGAPAASEQPKSVDAKPPRHRPTAHPKLKQNAHKRGASAKGVVYLIFLRRDLPRISNDYDWNP